VIDRELMQQALEALEAADESDFWVKQESIVNALRERLAQPEQEPVGQLQDAQPLRGAMPWEQLYPQFGDAIPPAAQPERKQDSTCNKTLRAEGKGYPRTCRKCGKGPCIADRVQPEQEQWDAIPDAFNDWWNADYDDSTNPFRLNSPAYWAWSGWSAANKEKNT
jgi:hypothetical protein